MAADCYCASRLGCGQGQKVLPVVVLSSARRGPKRAILAVAHRMLTAIYHMLTKREAYHDPGATYLYERSRTNLIKRTVKRFAQLGYQINIEPIQPVAA